MPWVEIFWSAALEVDLLYSGDNDHYGDHFLRISSAPQQLEDQFDQMCWHPRWEVLVLFDIFDDASEARECELYTTIGFKVKLPHLCILVGLTLLGPFQLFPWNNLSMVFGHNTIYYHSMIFSTIERPSSILNGKSLPLKRERPGLFGPRAWLHWS